MRPVRTLAASLAAVAFLAFALPFPARAQSATGEIDLEVTDAASLLPLADARTVLLGAQTASTLTNGTGEIKFTDVPVGVYRVRVQLRGYDGANTREFDVLPDRAVHVKIALSKNAGPASGNAAGAPGPGNLQVIGSVVVRSKVSITTTDINADSPIRRLSDSLTDALDKLGGVSVTTDTTDPSSPVQISLHNQDESQTALTLDGIPLSAPGAAGNLRGIGSDLFAGSSVNFSPAAGGLAGGVNFNTLQPTQALQVRVNGTTGTFDRSNYQLATTGSVRNLGFVLEHAWRGSNSPLTFRDYEDQSGLTYVHGGESTSLSDLVKLRYSLGDQRTSISATALSTNRNSSPICAQDVTILPCGIGPDNRNYGRYGLAFASVQTLIGNVQTNFSAYANSGHQTSDDLNRYVLAFDPLSGSDPTDPSAYAPTLDPSFAFTSTLARGIAYSTSIAQGNHTLTLSGNTYSATNASTPVVGSQYVTAFSNSAASSRYQFADAIKSSDKLTLTPSVSFADTSGLGGSFLAGINAQWTPKLRDAFSFSANVGSSQPNLNAVRSFSDPVAARFNCGAQTAVISGPGDTGDGARQSATAFNAAWTHRFNGGATLSLNAFSQLQSGQLIGALIAEPASYYTAAGPGYLDALYAAYRSPTVCGVSAALPTVYVQEQVGDTRRLYQGFDLSGRFEVAPYIALIPSYSVNSAVLEAAGPRLQDGPSTTIVGAQLPNRPVHRGNLAVDALLPRAGLELLANAQYVGANNQQNLGSYVNLSLGASHKLGPGQLTLFENNVFNTYGGDFATNANAQPLPLSNGALYLAAAQPLTPRTIYLSYSAAIGGPAPGPPFRQFTRARVAQAAPTPAPSAEPGAGGGPRGPQRFTSNPPPPGVDPLSLATARTTCDAGAQSAAKPLYDGLRAYVAAYEAGGKPADVAGVTIVPHKTPAGSSVAYFLELRPNFPRPPGQAGQAAQPGQTQGGSGSRARGGFGGFGGFGGPPEGPPGAGGPGGPPPGAGAPGEGPPAGGDVVAGSSSSRQLTPEQQAARRNFLNSPEVKAFRGFVGCAYVTLIPAADAKAKGIVLESGRPGLIYLPGTGLAFVQELQLPQGGGSLKGGS